MYYLETDDRELLDKIRREQVCAECGAGLWAYMDFQTKRTYLACIENPLHNGIAREPSRYEREGMAALNIETRRNFMVEQRGTATAVALRRYDAITTLDRKSAGDILEILFPGAGQASPAEVSRAVGLCVDYGADPRLNDLYLIPFKLKDKDDKGKVIGEHTAYQCVKGITFNRKVALRKHHYSYTDMTPRYMTEAEEKACFKTVNPDIVRFITKLKDMDTGAEGYGWGEWPRYRRWIDRDGKEHKEDNQPKAAQDNAKNSMENMAALRSERHALDRMYPMDMPPKNIPAIDEVEERRAVIDSTARQIDASKAEATVQEDRQQTFEELEEDLFGPDPNKVQPGPGGEVTMTEEEKKKANDDLRVLIRSLAGKLQAKKNADGSPRWTAKSISQKIREVLGIPISKIEDIPEDKLNFIANMLADYELIP